MQTHLFRQSVLYDTRLIPRFHLLRTISVKTIPDH